jgi:predicted restriction endonuclease
MYKENLTYSEAIEMVMKNNDGFASLKYIYDNFEKYREKTGKTPDNTIQEKVQRDNRFTRIGFGVYALTKFLENIEEYDLGFFTAQENNIIFKKKRQIDVTEKIVKQKIRVGQNRFRSDLLKLLKKCPITQIDEKKLLIASHIKPWIYSNNEERLNVNNGFLLSPLYDKLFDKGIGLITFTLDKEILISKKLSSENRARLSVNNMDYIADLPISGREEFLKYHRKYIFQR